MELKRLRLGTMSKLSPIKARELIQLLENSGLVQVRQKGNHIRLIHKDGRKTSVPVHSGEKVGKGLLRKILRDCNISRKEFEKLR